MSTRSAALCKEDRGIIPALNQGPYSLLQGTTGCQFQNKIYLTLVTIYYYYTSDVC